MNEQLGTISTLLVYGTIAAYTVAMIAFATDLSGFGRGVDRDRTRRAVNIAMSTAWLGLAFHVAALLLRGVAAGRVPWANMYEFTMMSTMFTVAAFLVVNRRKDVRYLGLPVMLVSVVALFLAVYVLYVAADGVQPALRSYWLIIHVSVATLATALFCVGAAASVLQLVKGRDERLRLAEQLEQSDDGDDVGGGADDGGGAGGAAGAAGEAPGTPASAPPGARTVVAPAPTAADAQPDVSQRLDLGGDEPEVLPARNTFFSRLLNAFPGADSLERMAYRFNAVGLVGWTFVLITGAIWAEYAWGRAWGWDPKEVVTLVVWIIYAAYCHVRLTTGWSKSKFAYFSLAGFAALLFNYYGVNIFINSLHSYAGV